MNTIHREMEQDVTWREFAFCEGRRRIPLERLLYIESRLHKLEFHVMEDKLRTYSIYDTLNRMQGYMESEDFLRIHQSFLLNMRYIQSICRYRAVLYDGRSFPIPKARYKGVWETYKAYRAGDRVG